MDQARLAKCTMCTCTFENVYKIRRKVKATKGADRVNKWSKCDVYLRTHIYVEGSGEV